MVKKEEEKEVEYMICSICGSVMEADDIGEYEFGDPLFCFPCGITSDSESFKQGLKAQKEAEKEWIIDNYEQTDFEEWL
jgi:hypothetical protein